MNQPQITITLQPAAFDLVMEGLSMLPLGRAKPLYEALEAEARKQIAAFAEQQKPKRKPRSKPA
jgi:hypothetical protein